MAVAALSLPLITPAWACGCGAYAPEHGGSATVPMETALVRVNADATEDIYLSLSVDSTVRSGALLFPVPDKHATVTAGPKNLFAELAIATAPPPDSGPGAGGGNKAGAPNSGVTVLNRQQIGPLDVVTLASGDPAALTRWLQRNGFAAKPALATAAKPYTDQKWAFVAVRLRPGAASSAALKGTLDPLRIHFASHEIVYPMRLSAMGTETERVLVYTLAAHRLELHSTTPGMTVGWAGDLRDVSAYPDLAKVAVADNRFLTRFDGRLTPDTITDDFHFSRASSDAIVRQHQTGDLPDVLSGADATPRQNTLRDVGLGVGAIVLLLVVALGLANWHNRRQQQSQ